MQIMTTNGRGWQQLFILCILGIFLIGLNSAFGIPVTHRVEGTYQMESDYFNIFPTSGTGTFEATITFDSDTPDSVSLPDMACYVWGHPSDGYSLDLKLIGNTTVNVSSVPGTLGRAYVFKKPTFPENYVEHQAFDAFDVDGATYSFHDSGDLTRFFFRFWPIADGMLVGDTFPVTPPPPGTWGLSSGGSLFQLRDASTGESRVRFMTATKWEKIPTGGGTPIPEPATLVLLAGGLIAVSVRRRKRIV